MGCLGELTMLSITADSPNSITLGRNPDRILNRPVYAIAAWGSKSKNLGHRTWSKILTGHHYTFVVSIYGILDISNYIAKGRHTTYPWCWGITACCNGSSGKNGSKVAVFGALTWIVQTPIQMTRQPQPSTTHLHLRSWWLLALWHLPTQCIGNYEDKNHLKQDWLMTNYEVGMLLGKVETWILIFGWDGSIFFTHITGTGCLWLAALALILALSIASFSFLFVLVHSGYWVLWYNPIRTTDNNDVA